MTREMRVVIGVILGVAFIGLKFAARSSRSNRYPGSSYNSGLDLQRLQREQLARELAQQEAQAREDAAAEDQLRASIYAEHCQTDQSSELLLEVQCASATFTSLAPLLVSDLLPEGSAWPKPAKVSGVEVQVLHRGAEAGTNPTCLDADAALIKRVRGGLKLADAHGTRVGGALVVKTTDYGAAQLMLASDVKAVVGGRGPVVAFVGSDNLAVFADSADLAAVRAAAKESASALDTAAEAGCSLIEPMVLNDGTGTWSTWKPPAALEGDVQAHRRAVNACLGVLVQDSLAALPRIRTELGPFPPGAELPTERRFDAKRGSVAKVSLDRLKGPQLVVQADFVELSHNDGRLTPLAWPVFLRATKKALTPLSLAGKRYPEGWLFDPEMAASLDTASNETLSALK